MSERWGRGERLEGTRGAAEPGAGTLPRIGAARAERLRVERDAPLEEDLPMRPSLRARGRGGVIVSMTTRITDVNRETRDDR